MDFVYTPSSARGCVIKEKDKPGRPDPYCRQAELKDINHANALFQKLPGILLYDYPHLPFQRQERVKLLAVGVDTAKNSARVLSLANGGWCDLDCRIEIRKNNRGGIQLLDRPINPGDIEEAVLYEEQRTLILSAHRGTFNVGLPKTEWCWPGVKVVPIHEDPKKQFRMDSVRDSEGTHFDMGKVTPETVAKKAWQVQLVAEALEIKELMKPFTPAMLEQIKLITNRFTEDAIIRQGRCPLPIATRQMLSRLLPGRFPQAENKSENKTGDSGHKRAADAQGEKQGRFKQQQPSSLGREERDAIATMAELAAALPEGMDETESSA